MALQTDKTGESRLKKIGLIGVGNIGAFILDTINAKQLIPDAKICAVYYRSGKDKEMIARKYGVKVFTNIQDFLKQELDLVIEAATIEAVKKYAAAIVKNKMDFLVVSVGAFADVAFYQELQSLCKQNQTSVYLPSGAIGGLDIVKAAKAVGELSTVSITTRKPPQALMDQPVTKETLLFEGSAKEAINKFPKNVNVAILLSLAGLGAEETRVRVVADPMVKRNTHTIEIAGSFGKSVITVENEPMPNNPKTSYLAALSVIAALKNQQEFIHIG